MRNDDYKEFDLELRSMFQDAEEEVPSRVWESLSSELDRRDRRKVVALRWRRAAISVAAAAAVLSGVFITTRHSGPQGPADVQPLVAQSAPEQAVPQEVLQEEDIPTIEEQIASAPRSYFAQAEPVTVTTEEAVEETVPSETVPVEVFDTVDETPAPVVETPVTEASKSQERATVKEETPWVDPFAQLEDEPEERVLGKSFTISGNTMSNDMSGNTRPMRAPSALQKAKTGVQDKSVSTFGIPLTLGVGARVDITDKFSIGTGIGWSLLSRSFTGIYTEVDSKGQVTKSINSEINNDLHYIGIPLNLYYNLLLNRNLKFYVWGGGSVEKGLVNYYRIQNGTGDIHYKENVKGFQWSTALGVGLEFAINDYLGLYIDPSARYYFDCKQPTSVRTQKPYMLNFEVGLRFNL